MNDKVLCIGGVADGERHEPGRGRYTTVQKLARMEGLMYGDNLKPDDLVQVRRSDYRIEKLTTNHTLELKVLVEESHTVTDALRLLVEHYHPKITYDDAMARIKEGPFK